MARRPNGHRGKRLGEACYESGKRAERNNQKLHNRRENNPPGVVFSVATPAEPHGEKNNSWCKVWAVENFWKSAGEKVLSGVRGAYNFRTRFGSFFAFSNHFSYQFKFFSGAISVCRRAALFFSRIRLRRLLAQSTWQTKSALF